MEPDICRNNHGGDEFSEQANDAVSKEVWRQKVLEFIGNAGSEGCIADEVTAHFSVSPNTVAPRLTELKKAGLLIPLITGDRQASRKTRAGKRAGVWITGEHAAIKKPPHRVTHAMRVNHAIKKK